MRQWKSWLALLLMIVCIPVALAQSPAGKWTTIDDKTGKKRAVVRVNLSGDTLSATIVSIFSQPEDTGTCDNCPGEFKGKKIEGLQFVWGLKNKGNGEWADGQILDPKTGKIYRAKMTLKGNKLYVRGFIGVAMLGRTQIWVR